MTKGLAEAGRHGHRIRAAGRWKDKSSGSPTPTPPPPEHSGSRSSAPVDHGHRGRDGGALPALWKGTVK